MRDLPDRLGPALRRLRKLRYLTQDEVAEQAGISRVQVGRFERGERLPSLPALVKVLAALDARLQIRASFPETSTEDAMRLSEESLAGVCEPADDAANDGPGGGEVGPWVATTSPPLPYSVP